MEKSNGIAPNSRRILWAGFMAILAEGVGFSVRGGILGDWGKQFGFTLTDLGGITGGGLTGFGIIILIFALMGDWIGYGRLMIFAFIMHTLSAVVTLAATPVYNSMVATNPEAARFWAYQCVYWGMFIFAIGNGTCEAVANPLVATLFPKNRTHYLNILHAGWPAGLVLGSLASLVMSRVHIRWEIQMVLFLIPTIAYGIMCLGQKFPKSEASAHGVKFTERLREVGVLGAFVICMVISVWFRQLCTGYHLPQWWGALVAGILWLVVSGLMKFSLGPALFALMLCCHAMQGYVELGTDSWISNITGNILASPSKGLLLFVYISTLMFLLRFCAGPIVHKISPPGLLFVGAVCSAIGLSFLGYVQTGFWVVVAASVYGIGKTFMWPTLLAFVSERFPKGGAITIGAMGGIGMLAAGLLGGPGIGYNQDYAASRQLKQTDPAAYDQYKSTTHNKFLFFPEIQGLDGSKLGEIRDKAQALPTSDNPNPPQLTPAEKEVHDADLYGGRSALRTTAIIPAIMATIFLLLILYFKAKGGYKQVHIEGAGEGAHEEVDPQAPV